MPPWVFPSRTGTALEERNIRHLFERMLTKAGLQITVDTCRHLIPGANRGAVDRPDDAPAMQPSATRAQPEPWDETDRNGEIAKC